MLTNKGKYGLKALGFLAQAPVGIPVMASEIARENNIPKKFLDAILAELRKAGLVRSRKGRSGGYELARLAEKIEISAALRALDGPLAPFRCASMNYYERCSDCEVEGECLVHLLMVDIRDAIVSVTDHRTLADLPTRKGKGRQRPASGTKATALSQDKKKALSKKTASGAKSSKTTVKHVPAKASVRTNRAPKRAAL